MSAAVTAHPSVARLKLLRCGDAFDFFFDMNAQLLYEIYNLAASARDDRANSEQRKAKSETRNAAFLRLQYANTELRHLGVQRGRFQCCDDRLARLRRVDDLVDPQPRR